MKTMEEEELSNLREQQRRFQELRNAELAEQQDYPTSPLLSENLKCVSKATLHFFTISFSPVNPMRSEFERQQMCFCYQPLKLISK